MRNRPAYFQLHLQRVCTDDKRIYYKEKTNLSGKFETIFPLESFHVCFINRKIKTKTNKRLRTKPYSSRNILHVCAYEISKFHLSTWIQRIFR